MARPQWKHSGTSSISPKWRLSVGKYIYSSSRGGKQYKACYSLYSEPSQDYQHGCIFSCKQYTCFSPWKAGGPFESLCQL